MMKRLSVSLVLALGCLFAAAPAAKAEFVFIAFMGGSNENPPNPSGGFGIGIYVLSNDATRLDWAMSYFGLEGGNTSGAHFHRAAAGSNGPVVRGYPNAMFPSPGGFVTGAWTSDDAAPLTEELAVAMFEGNIYFNIHTPQWPGGEIRGQLTFFFGY